MPEAICKEVCKPIIVELNSRDEKLKTSLEKTAEKVRLEQEKTNQILTVKLDGIYTCLSSKIPSRLFWRVIGGFFTLVFGICGIGIAGTLWSIYGTVLEVNQKVEVMAVTVKNTREDLKYHLVRYEMQNRAIDERLDKVERGETYYRYHEKTEKEKRK